MMLPRNSPHRTESTLAYNNNNNNGSSLFQRKPLAPINSEFKISKPQHIKPNTHSHTFTTPTPKTRNTATTTTTTNNNNRNNHQYRNPNLNTSLVFTPTKNSSSSSSHSSSLLSSSPFVEEPENQPESNHTRATSHYRTTSTSQYKSSVNKDASHSLITSSKKKNIYQTNIRINKP